MTSAPSPSVPAVSFFADPFKKLFFQHQPQSLKANSSLGFHASASLARFFVFFFFFYRALFFTPPSLAFLPCYSSIKFFNAHPTRPFSTTAHFFIFLSDTHRRSCHCPPNQTVFLRSEERRVGKECRSRWS